MTYKFSCCQSYCKAKQDALDTTCHLDQVFGVAMPRSCMKLSVLCEQAARPLTAEVGIDMRLQGNSGVRRTWDSQGAPPIQIPNNPADQQSQHIRTLNPSILDLLTNLRAPLCPLLTALAFRPRVGGKALQPSTPTKESPKDRRPLKHYPSLCHEYYQQSSARLSTKKATNLSEGRLGKRMPSNMIT